MNDFIIFLPPNSKIYTPGQFSIKSGYYPSRRILLNMLELTQRPNLYCWLDRNVPCGFDGKAGNDVSVGAGHLPAGEMSRERRLRLLPLLLQGPEQ